MTDDSYFQRGHYGTSPPPTRLITIKSMPERSSPAIPTTLTFSQSMPNSLHDLSQHSKNNAKWRKTGFDANHEDASMSAPSRPDDGQTLPRFLNQPRHDNWQGPFRLPPPPPVLLVDASPPRVTEKKKAATTKTGKASATNPVQDSPTAARSMVDSTTWMALEQIMQVFPEVDFESTRDMLERSTVETVMNQLAEESHGAWGEVDSICGLYDRRRSCSLDDDSLDDYLQSQLDQIAEIFPEVDGGRSEDLLRRNSISTVLMILASEASSQPFSK